MDTDFSEQSVDNNSPARDMTEQEILDIQSLRDKIHEEFENSLRDKPRFIDRKK